MAPHPVAPDASSDQCPVDHETRAAWLQHTKQDAPKSESSSALAFLSSQKEAHSGDTASRPSSSTNLSTERVVSSIPRYAMWQQAGEDEKDRADTPDPSTSKHWVYPSPSQFFQAMARKQHNPQEKDMDVVVPIHNAVNERAWQQILEWERSFGDGGQSYAACGGPKLVSFKGKPKEATWRAWWRSMIGYGTCFFFSYALTFPHRYQKPFDRHDWEVDRCGTRIKYVIDFYTGRPNPSGGMSFYLDVRPSPGQWEGVRMRVAKTFGLAQTTV